MASGGVRTGTPGTSYSNRSDLNTVQPIRTAPSTSYGSRVANERAQQAQPLPQQPAIHPAVAALMQPQQGPEPPVQPLFRPTEMPNEPVQQGLGTGPGPNDEMLLRALKERYPTAGMIELFNSMGLR